MRNLKKTVHMNYLQNRNRVTDVENKGMVTRRGKEGGGINWEIGIDIYILIILYIIIYINNIY